MKKVVLNSLIIASAAALVVACDEENPLGGSNGASELKLGEYYLEAEGIVSYLYNITDKAYNDSTFNASDSTVIWGIPVVATSTSAMELRFGNGVTGSDGITRKGKVIVNETSKPSVIIQPKSMIGLIPLNIKDKKAQIVVSTV